MGTRPPHRARGARRHAGPECLRRADPSPHTTVAPDGSVVSVQAVELSLPAQVLGRRWSAAGLERLGEAYFHALERLFVGVVRGVKAPSGVNIVLIASRVVLLRLGPPRRALQPERASVRWPIEGGLLAAPTPPDSGPGGYLAVEARRHAVPGTEHERVRVELRVVGFRPSVAKWLGRRVYLETQARIHLLVAHRYLGRLPRYFARPACAG